MSLLWHIASLGARWLPVTRVEPAAISVEDVTPPFELPPEPRPIPEPEPNECGLSSCKNPVTWPSYWCSEDHLKWFLRDLYKPGPSTEAA